jgi:hypothetical protein
MTNESAELDGPIPCSIAADDRDFLKQFDECTLGKSCWSHEAHIRMAWLRMEQFKSYEEALERIRSGIQAFNSSVNSIGYHETITVAFSRLIYAKRAETRAGTWQEFLQHHPNLLQKRCLLEFYSKEILASERARHEFVKPDKKPLP